ncbi:MAG: cell division protein FtsL [Nitrospira sp.]|nr:cell division protein FtsL [Nitrospira sp.]MDE0406198.1 cell division protein FtsL [Nitrospira sp.]MDE0485967.1 cell division protein FtsL [Nitrospira sp.]
MKWVLWTLLVVSVSGMLLFYVWGKVDVVRVGYELDALLKKKAALTQEHERLQARLSQLTAPERIASEAGDKLDMKPPRARQVVLVPGHPGDENPSDGPELPLRLARQTGE